jgi:hypothetical protein
MASSSAIVRECSLILIGRIPDRALRPIGSTASFAAGRVTSL